MAASSALTLRPVVGGEPELEARLKLEGLAVEEAGGDGVASGEELEESFGECFAVVDFDRDDEAGAGEAGDVIADPGVAVPLEEGLEVGGGGVLAEHGADGFQFRALAGGARPVGEEQDFLAGAPVRL